MIDPEEWTLQNRLEALENAVASAEDTQFFDQICDAWLECRSAYMVAFAERIIARPLSRRLRKCQKRTVSLLKGSNPYSEDWEYADHYVEQIHFHQKILRLKKRGKLEKVHRLLDQKVRQGLERKQEVS